MPFTRLRYHIISRTYERLPLITPKIEATLYPAIRAEATERRGVILEIGGTADHVHLIAAVRPSMSLSLFVGAVKSVSSRIVRQAHGRNAFRWQSGYSAFSLNAMDYDDCRRYVRHQKHHHATHTLRRDYERFDDE